MRRDTRRERERETRGRVSPVHVWHVSLLWLLFWADTQFCRSALTAADTDLKGSGFFISTLCTSPLSIRQRQQKKKEDMEATSDGRMEVDRKARPPSSFRLFARTNTPGVGSTVRGLPPCADVRREPRLFCDVLFPTNEWMKWMNDKLWSDGYRPIPVCSTRMMLPFAFLGCFPEEIPPPPPPFSSGSKTFGFIRLGFHSYWVMIP